MQDSPSKRHYAAMFLVSLCLLVLEISFARLLSVALSAGYAFVAISMAMFGLGLSGLIVYLLPARFAAERLDEQLITFTSGFALTAALSIAFFLGLPVIQEVSLQGLIYLGGIYLVLTVPFVLGGLCISLLMTHFSADMGRIYFADLVGASLGCIVVVLAMEMIPAPYVSVLVAVAASGGATTWAVTRQPRRLLLPVFCACGVGVLALSSVTTDLYRLKHIKGNPLSKNWSEYEKWNSFSRISAWERRKFNAAQSLPMPRPMKTYAGTQYPGTMMLDIDGAAWTPMMNFDGNIETIQFLRESVLYAVHHFRPQADVLLIGLGGGRDILAALAFEQRSVTGIEINSAIRHVVEEEYGEYSGRPYTLPGVEVLIDEGRSRLHQIDRTFDVIQLSMIDTLSLNAAGGLVFSENNLYTVEAFRQYYEHLNDGGLLNLTRYFDRNYSVEIVRLAILAREAWEAEGVGNFGNHIAVLSGLMTGTVLIKKSPFTAEDLALMDELAAKNYFHIEYRPEGVKNHREVAEAITTPNLAQFIDDHKFLVHAPTDDRPFFWNFLRHRLDAGTLARDAKSSFKFFRLWNDALNLMYMLIFIVAVLAIVFFLGPLLLFAKRRPVSASIGRTATFLLYFACLGYGFIMIEIPLLQMLILFLGKPIYALAVVLFSLLLLSGIGSLTTTRFDGNEPVVLPRILVGIVVLAAAYATGLPWAIDAMLGLPTAAKVVITVLLLAPIGLLLGMAYPMGIAMLRELHEELVPWAWGMNGAMSVVASVLAAFLSSRIGFRAALLTGMSAYAIALVCVFTASRAKDLEAAGEGDQSIDIQSGAAEAS